MPRSAERKVDIISRAGNTVDEAASTAAFGNLSRVGDTVYHVVFKVGDTVYDTESKGGDTVDDAMSRDGDTLDDVVSKVVITKCQVCF